MPFSRQIWNCGTSLLGSVLWKNVELFAAEPVSAKGESLIHCILVCVAYSEGGAGLADLNPGDLNQ